jgi:PTS system nitrogen regulatory IIA component
MVSIADDFTFRPADAPCTEFAAVGVMGKTGERFMKLTVRDVIKFLKVSESTIIRWIKQRGLPAHRVAGQYRFNRAEILEWATAQQIQVSTEMFENAEKEAEPAPSFAGALEAGGIFYQLHDSTKERALWSLVDVLPLPEGTDRQLLLHLFLAREALASTAIGDGIALPHVRSPIVLHVPRPLITLGFLEKPVDFGALDGKPVNMLFSLISPTVHTHLQLLSRLSFALHDAKFKEVVMRPGTPAEILAEARRVEAGLGASATSGGKAGA